MISNICTHKHRRLFRAPFASFTRPARGSASLARGAGSSELDELLGGGVTAGDLTEVYGEYRTGKSQLMYTLAVQAQLDQARGGANGKTLFIDTEGSFKAERIAPIANRFSLDADAVMNYIFVAKPLDVDALITIVKRDAPRMLAEHKNIKLMIVDSLISLYRAEYVGRGELATRQALVNQLLTTLKHLSKIYNVAIIYTNQVMATPDAAATMGAPIAKACGGHIVAHASTTRIQFKKGRDNARKAKLIDAPHLPESEAEFFITEGGISDDS